MSIRDIVRALVVLWLFLGMIQVMAPADQVFHYLNAVAVSAGIITIASYAPAVWYAWHDKEEGLRPAHLLAFGVTTNWIGFLIRLGRWFVVDGVPAPGIAQAFYNFGMWISITAAALLVAALALSPPQWSWEKINKHAIAFIALTGVLWFLGYTFEVGG